MPMQPIHVVAYPHAYVYPMHPTHVRLHSGYPAASQELEQEISSIQRDDEPVERSWDEMMGGHVELQCECLHQQMSHFNCRQLGILAVTPHS